MLKLTLPAEELFDETTETFSETEPIDVVLEHSLVSLSKWESKFKKPFLSSTDKTINETLWYAYAMIVSPELDDSIMRRFTAEHFDVIDEYINSPESATTFGMLPKQTGRGETITSELIYYWLVVFNIPFETERWHLNRLFSLIKICNIKNSKPKKMGRNEIAQRNRELNAQRRAAYNTSG